ncbi:diguanylate cyclase, partial [Candidatus Bipolaricaulota bacterium]|nr:diguanylate cyclase [Candidatus Bipolaricaulota bacterium]
SSLRTLVRITSATSRRHGHPLSLAILDLDNFKAINDRYGHWIGDEVLRERLISAWIRESK